MPWVHHNYLHHWIQHVLAATLAATILYSVLWFARRKDEPQQRHEFLGKARKLVCCFWLIAAFVPLTITALLDGPYYFESKTDGACIAVTIDDIGHLRKKYDTFDQFIVTATPSARAALNRWANLGGISFTPQTTWRVDIEDTSISSDYRGPAVLVRSSGTRTAETHFDLDDHCPEGTGWLAE
jgi:hypothetical protein